MGNRVGELRAGAPKVILNPATPLKASGEKGSRRTNAPSGTKRGTGAQDADDSFAIVRG